ncbi:unnamed protein product [Effrenium voratum]|nr:unnamed protein product [Effrenium voratum]
MLGKVAVSLLIACIVVQFLDIMVHVATDQVEILRIIGSVAIMIWAGIWAGLRCGGASFPKMMPVLWLCWAAIALIYLVLNIIFLIEEGFTNDGRPRITLFLFVIATLGLGCGGVFLLARAASSESKAAEPTSAKAMQIPA